MDAYTRPSGASEAGALNWCHFHQGESGTAVQVDVADAGSGPGGFEIHACAPCREQRGLVPWSERVA